MLREIAIAWSVRHGWIDQSTMRGGGGARDRRYSDPGDACEPLWPEAAPGRLLLVDRMALANARVRTVAEQEHVRVVDAGVVLSGDPANFADHAQFTNKGAEKMGMLLAGQ